MITPCFFNLEYLTTKGMGKLIREIYYTQISSFFSSLSSWCKTIITLSYRDCNSINVLIVLPDHDNVAWLKVLCNFFAIATDAIFLWVSTIIHSILSTIIQSINILNWSINMIKIKWISKFTSFASNSIFKNII